MNNTTIKTRQADGMPAITTNLSINWDGMTDDDVKALAQQALIVKLQGKWRAGVKAGTGTIPTEETVNAVDHKVGTRAPKALPDLAAMIAALSPEQKAAMLAKLTESDNG